MTDQDSGDPPGNMAANFVFSFTTIDVAPTVTSTTPTNGDIFLTISGNSSVGINEDGILVRQATVNNTFSLEDFAGNGTVAGDVDSYLEGQNPGTTARVRTGGSVVNYTTMNLNNTNTPAPLTPLMVAPGGVDAQRGSSLKSNGAGPTLLTQAALDSVFAAAMERWKGTGLTTEQIAVLRNAKFEIADLPGSYLAEVAGNHIRIDRDAGGYGWFVDSTPMDDQEFGDAVSGMRRYTNRTGAPAGHIDLLTAIEQQTGRFKFYIIVEALP